MRVIRTIKHAKYTCEQIAEVFQPDFCARVGWTPTNNYIPGDDEHAYVLDDATHCDVGWRVRDGVPITPEVDVLEDVKVDKLEEITEDRKQTEHGGVKFAGLHVATDAESLSLLTGAMTTYQAVGLFPTIWKCLDGWLDIETPEEFMTLAMAVSGHVNECFLKERQFNLLVNACNTVEEVRSISWTF